MTASERDQLEAAIVAQERLRDTVGDAVVDATVAVLRTRLAELDAAPRRRQVTVLFADVKGFTAMSETMDAEHVAAVMNRVWADLDEVVTRRGGRVDKHIGDALMAVWGADSTHEDDPEMAVRAGLELTTELERFCDREHVALQMRVGINTGPVLLGTVGSGAEFTAMGDTVNVASRLEQLCTPGRVLIAHDTYRHVRGAFDVRRRDPVAVKGKSQLLVTYEVLAAKPRAFRLPTRGVEGVETGMVGREAELDALCAAFGDVVAGGRSRLVTVVGDAGVGKSRLLYEFDNWLELLPDDVYYFKGRAVQQRASVPMALARDLVASRMQIAEGDPAADVARKLAEGTAGVLNPDEVDALAGWLGFGTPDRGSVLTGEALAAAGRTYLVEFLRSLARRHPLVILVEDLHWADPGSLAFVVALPDLLGDVPVLVVGAARPAVRERQEWPAATDTVELGALGPAASRQLVEEVLQRVDALPPALVDAIVQRGEGNAFYLEELVKMLIDDGVVQVGDDRWTVDPARCDLDRVPPTLTGVLQSRIDALSERARATAQAAAVVGRVFWRSAVDHLIGTASDVDTVVARELAYDRASRFPHTTEHMFKHALLRDVAYETVLLGDRPTLHRRAAEWLADVTADRRDEYLVEIAEHHEHAGDMAPAAALFVEAAQLARRSAVLVTARALAERGIRAAGDDERLRLAALVELADAEGAMGAIAESHAHARAAVESARARGDTGTLVRATALAAMAAEILGLGATTRPLIDEALAVARRTSADHVPQILVAAAWMQFDEGDTSAAQELLREAMAEAERRDDHRAMCSAERGLASILSNNGDFEGALTHVSRSIEISRSTGDLYSMASDTANLGVLAHLRGDADGHAEHYREAAGHYRAALELSRRIGAGELEGTARSNLAQVHLRLGELDEAERLLRTAAANAVRVGSVTGQLFVLLVHIEICAARGHTQRLPALLGLVERTVSRAEDQSEIERVLGRLPAGVAGSRESRFEAGRSLDLAAEVARIADATP